MSSIHDKSEKGATKMNVKLLRKVKRHILAEPKRLNMGWWASKDAGRRAPACGTTGCIAGWAVLLNNPELIKVKFVEPEREGREAYDKFYEIVVSKGRANARKLLGLVRGQSRRLFFVENWPEKFRTDHNNACGKKSEEAKTTAARIEHFIKTKGRE